MRRSFAAVSWSQPSKCNRPCATRPRGRTRLLRLLVRLLVVLEKLREADVRERMANELANDGHGKRRAVRADHRRLHHVHRMAHARGEHLRVEVEVRVDGADLL